MSAHQWPPIGHLATGILICLTGGFCSVWAQVSPGPLSRPHEFLEGSRNCFKCHGNSKQEMNPRCLECHDDIDWLMSKGRGLHGQSTSALCAECHPEHGGRDFKLIFWKEGDPVNFDHARAGWALTGRHTRVLCRDCHKPAFFHPELADLGGHADPGHRWTGLDPACGSCHEDIHDGTLGSDCAQCHGGLKWRPAARFDHDVTGFPLTGRHSSVECAGCHLASHLDLETDAAGVKRPLYKPLSHQECSSCHEDVHAGRLGEDCSRCHVTESFRTVAREGFDHGKTRYPLEGAHLKLQCADCHADTAWGNKPPYQLCGGCHKDVHQGQATLDGRSVDCSACHSVSDWRSSTFTVSRHDESAYPLVGAHRGVKCRACHGVTAGKETGQFGTAQISFRPEHDACKDCHLDAHAGQLEARPDKGSCESCHDVHGWKPSRVSAADHARFTFPLTGKHAETECLDCHGPERPGLPTLARSRNLGTARVALRLDEKTCGDCHGDPHGGRYAESGQRGEQCRSCHDTYAFNPSHVDLAMHATFSFSLDGSHRAVPCHDCHAALAEKPPSSSLRLASHLRKLSFAEKASCSGCHSDPHGAQFQHRAGGDSCESCHDTDRFEPSTFDHERDSRFPLKAGHADVPCGKCHQAAADKDGERGVIYRMTPRECEACHDSSSGLEVGS